MCTVLNITLYYRVPGPNYLGQSSKLVLTGLVPLKNMFRTYQKIYYPFKEKLKSSRIRIQKSSLVVCSTQLKQFFDKSETVQLLGIETRDFELK